MSTVVVGLVHSAAAEIEAELWSYFPLQGLREQIPVAKRETWIERQSTVWRVGLVLELPAQQSLDIQSTPALLCESVPSRILPSSPRNIFNPK